MTNLFEHSTIQQIKDRLQRLRPESKPLWGKMNVSQMLAHCQGPFRSYFGEYHISRGLFSFLVGGLAKKKLFSDKPWPKSLPTAREFIIPDERDFEKERKDLLDFIEKFIKEGAGISPPQHPFFGKMSTDDWAVLHYRHLDHHLKQFGV